ncbi:MAG: hypothetical protein ACREH3_19760 [Geminicoccales bacterium]
MATESKRPELLQSAFNLRLYGRVIEGIHVEQSSLNGPIAERAELRAQLREIKDEIAALRSKSSKAGLSESPQPSYTTGSSSDASWGWARLANIYGYARGNARTILPRPLAFMVDRDGEDATGWDTQFSKDDGFKYWEVDPDETTWRLEVKPGRFNELLAPEIPEELAAGATEPDGGTMIRGADNRLYLIPMALEPFEVRDPREASDLQIQSQYGREIKVDSVRSLTGRSTLVARSTLQVRSTLTLRSTLAAAGNRSTGPTIS